MLSVPCNKLLRIVASRTFSVVIEWLGTGVLWSWVLLATVVGKHISFAHEYFLCYQFNISTFACKIYENNFSKITSKPSSAETVISLHRDSRYNISSYSRNMHLCA